MKKDNIILGIVLVFIGLFLLLNNLNIIRWSIIKVALDLWPLILIALGASIIFHENKIARTFIWIAFFAIIIIYGFYLQYKFYGIRIYNFKISHLFNSNSISHCIHYFKDIL